MDEHYATEGQQVKSRLKRPLQAPRSLRYSAQLAKFAGKQRDDTARFAELHDTEDKGGCLLTGQGESRGLACLLVQQFEPHAIDSSRAYLEDSNADLISPQDRF